MKNICNLIETMVRDICLENSNTLYINMSNDMINYLDNKYEYDVANAKKCMLYKVNNNYKIYLVLCNANSNLNSIMTEDLIESFSDDNFIKYSIIFIPNSFNTDDIFTLISFYDLIAKTIVKKINDFYNIDIFKNHKYLILIIITCIIRDTNMLTIHDYSEFYDKIITKSHFFRYNLNDSKIRIIKYLMENNFENTSIITNGTIYNILKG